MVDDASRYVDELLSEMRQRQRNEPAQRTLRKLRPSRGRTESLQPADQQALANVAAEIERERLFGILEEFALGEHDQRDGASRTGPDRDLAELAAGVRTERRSTGTCPSNDEIRRI